MFTTTCPFCTKTGLKGYPFTIESGNADSEKEPYDTSLNKACKKCKIAPIQALKTQYLGSKNPRLHTDEVLIALSATAATNEEAALALEQLPKLRNCQVHSTVMLSSVDLKIFKKLMCDVTCDAKTK